jgi:hypothetical protein
LRSRGAGPALRFALQVLQARARSRLVQSLNGRCVQIFKVEGGVITDTRLYFDQAQVMTQLGLMPEPAIA